LKLQGYFKDTPPSVCAFGIATVPQQLEVCHSLRGRLGPIMLDQQLSGQSGILGAHKLQTQK
jgi:hypothetical protein